MFAKRSVVKVFHFFPSLFVGLLMSLVKFSKGHIWNLAFFFFFSFSLFGHYLCYRKENSI
jgi:hypothetical protein